MREMLLEMTHLTTVTYSILSYKLNNKYYS